KEAVVITFSNRIGYLSCGSGTYIDNVGIYGYIFIDASACYLYAVRGMDKLSNKNMVIIKALHLDININQRPTFIQHPCLKQGLTIGAKKWKGWFDFDVWYIGALGLFLLGLRL
ncbi:hypothetical protein, partial [Bathymodiolus thermophilus thioautotrophic gill symbiont]